MKTSLRDKVVLITGASGGIGSAMAEQFAAEGAKVILHYRKNRVKELPGGMAIRADLTKEADVARMFAQAVDHFGRVDTLIANAGSWETKDVPVHKMSLRQWHYTLDNVLTSTFLSLREFFRIVARQKRGNALLVASTAAVFGEADHADYAAAKSAMAFGLTRSLKNEIARIAPTTRTYCGGRVNCICPGWTVVPRTAYRVTDQKAVSRITSTMPLRKLGQTTDMANAAVFLSSDTLAGHITGQTIVMAGGMEGRLLWPL